jgi:prepilin-type N-terminal cleavage/methylation domain-containing protein
MSVLARLRSALSGRLRDERGFTIVEALVALSILSIAGAGFAVTTNGGLRLIGTSQERQSAVQVANEWMEQARVVPFDGLALPTGMTFGDATTPDAAVSVDHATFSFEGQTEPLVYDDGSTFGHLESETVNGVDFDAYRYVTWVADGAAANAYKRVTVVVQWDATGTDTASVSLSSLVAGDGIGWTTTTTAVGATTTTTTRPTTTSTTAPTTTTTAAAGACVGDTAGPTGSLAILAGSGSLSGFTSSSTVTVSLAASDACAPITMAFSNDGASFSTPMPFVTSGVWTLNAGDGTRTMWVRYTDGAGNTSAASASVIVDGTKPTMPGSFTATVLNSPKRVVLRWTQSTDAQGVLGYRIYLASGSGSFQNQSTGVVHPCPTSPCTWTHAGVKNKDTYTYYVVAYDAAGNESDHTAHLTRTI